MKRTNGKKYVNSDDQNNNLILSERLRSKQKLLKSNVKQISVYESDKQINDNTIIDKPLIQTSIVKNRKSRNNKENNFNKLDKNKPQLKTKRQTVSNNNNNKIDVNINILNDNKSEPQINSKQTPIRRSTRIRNKTQLYSQTLTNNDNNNGIKRVLKPKTTKNVENETKIRGNKRKSIEKKRLNKPKKLKRRSIPKSYNKLNFVESGMFAVLHKKLGMISKRLSVIPEARESDFEDL
jgi:hypothetical protein